MKSDTHQVKHVFHALRKVDAVSRGPAKDESDPQDTEEDSTEPIPEPEDKKQPEEPKKEEPQQQKNLFEFG